MLLVTLHNSQQAQLLYLIHDHLYHLLFFCQGKAHFEQASTRLAAAGRSIEKRKARSRQIGPYGRRAPPVGRHSIRGWRAE